MRRKPSRAVAEAHAPKLVEADDATRARWRSLDWFASPPWATRAGIEVARQVDACFGAGMIWEPACGDGIMAKVLADEVGPERVIATDIEPQGYGQRQDFLGEADHRYGVRWIFTNPPFANAAEFVERGLGIAKVGVAILCRVAFLESASRHELNLRHLTDFAIFTERVPMQLGPWNPRCSTATAYAWLIYQKAGRGEYIRGHLIEPGTRARLTMSDDIRRFCPEGLGTLL